MLAILSTHYKICTASLDTHSEATQERTCANVFQSDNDAHSYHLIDNAVSSNRLHLLCSCSSSTVSTSRAFQYDSSFAKLCECHC
jgi:hypothetical protein